MKKIFLVILIAGFTVYAANTGKIYDFARKAAWYVLINTNKDNRILQFPKQPRQFQEETTRINVYTPNNTVPYQDKGLLTISSKRDIEISFYDIAGYNKICTHKIKAGSQKQIELKKGDYQAEIREGKTVRLTTVSCISHEGRLEL